MQLNVATMTPCIPGDKGVHGTGTERVVVMERSSGKLLTGPAAPTEATLADWLVKHPTFEVLQPGQSQSGASGLGSKYKQTSS